MSGRQQGLTLPCGQQITLGAFSWCPAAVGGAHSLSAGLGAQEPYPVQALVTAGQLDLPQRALQHSVLHDTGLVHSAGCLERKDLRSSEEHVQTDPGGLAHSRSTSCLHTGHSPCLPGLFLLVGMCHICNSHFKTKNCHNYLEQPTTPPLCSRSFNYYIPHLAPVFNQCKGRRNRAGPSSSKGC